MLMDYGKKAKDLKILGTEFSFSGVKNTDLDAYAATMKNAGYTVTTAEAGGTYTVTCKADGKETVKVEVDAASGDCTVDFLS